MYGTSFILSILLAVTTATPLNIVVRRGCTEGFYNCLDGKVYQQCVAGGIWSVRMPVAPGTTCKTGVSANPWLAVEKLPAASTTAVVPQALSSSPAAISACSSSTAASKSSSSAAAAAAAAALTTIPSALPPPPPITLPSRPTETTSAITVSSAPVQTTQPKPDTSRSTDGTNTGNGQFTPIANWPTFEQMLAANPLGACSQSWGVADNSPTETQQLINAIKTRSDVLDPRFILAIVMQESGGCVRVITTNNGIRNPGVMQDFNGAHTCNDNGVVLNPCPVEQINGMITDGVSGGDNNFSKNIAAARAAGLGDSFAYAVAARNYNSGSVDFNNLSRGFGSDNSYVSRIMSRLGSV